MTTSSALDRLRLADARHTIAPLPQTPTQARKGRSLSCHDCRTPIPAGTVRCRDCAAAARYRTTGGAA